MEHQAFAQAAEDFATAAGLAVATAVAPVGAPNPEAADLVVAVAIVAGPVAVATDLVEAELAAVAELVGLVAVPVVEVELAADPEPAVVLARAVVAVAVERHLG